MEICSSVHFSEEKLCVSDEQKHLSGRRDGLISQIRIDIVQASQ